MLNLVTYAGGKSDKCKTLGCLFQKGFRGKDCTSSQKALDSPQKGLQDWMSEVNFWISTLFPSLQELREDSSMNKRLLLSWVHLLDLISHF